MPVIPATQEAEAGELPEPRRRRLQYAEIAPLHSSLGNKSETPSQKKKKKDLHKAQSSRSELRHSLCYLEWASECGLLGLGASASSPHSLSHLLQIFPEMQAVYQPQPPCTTVVHSVDPFPRYFIAYSSYLLLWSDSIHRNINSAMAGLWVSCF